VSITDLIPALKGHGRRRAIDEVERLRRNEIALLTNLHAAGDEIALLQSDLAEARQQQNEAEELLVKQLANLDDLRAENDQLTEENSHLKTRFAAQLAADANANRITVPPMVRPVDGPEDEATAPIDVRPLWDAHGIRPVTDPGQVH
jgi:FtsZ-binding cell division protein ZapB